MECVCVCVCSQSFFIESMLFIFLSFWIQFSMTFTIFSRFVRHFKSCLYDNWFLLAPLEAFIPFSLYIYFIHSWLRFFSYTARDPPTEKCARVVHFMDIHRQSQYLFVNLISFFLLLSSFLSIPTRIIMRFVAVQLLLLV